MPCPLKNFRAPELAAQRFALFLEELVNLSAAEVVLKHTLACSDADRSWILEDFEAARQHLTFSLIMQTACWTHLPHRLCCLGHFDESVARAEAANCLRLWASFSKQEQTSAHAWTKALLKPGSQLSQQLREFIRGAALKDLPELECVAAKFKFIPLSEKAIEGRHAVLHKTLKKASNAGPVFLSMAERMPLLVHLSKTKPSLIQDLAQFAEDLYHPLKASITMGVSGHPDLAPLVAGVVQERSGIDSCMLWGSTQKHAKEVKRVVYHVDSTALFMNLSGVVSMDDPGAGHGQKVKGAAGNFSFEEKAAFQKLLDVHQPSNLYSIDRDSSFRLKSLASAVQAHSQPAAVSLTVGDDEKDADLLFDFSADGGVGMELKPAEENAPLVFRILPTRPTRLKLPQTDRLLDLDWTDIAVSILPVWEVSNLGSPDASMLVSCCPDAPSANSVSVISKGGFASVQIWEREAKVQCCFDQNRVTTKDPAFAEDLEEVADALVRANAFPGTVTGLLDSGLPESQIQCLEELAKQGLVYKSPSTSLWQIAASGVGAFRVGFKLSKPKTLVDLEKDLPITERSESALLLALRKADWQLFEWRKSKANPCPDPYPIEFPAWKAPPKYFYVNAGRQSVGHSYLAILVGLSDVAFIDFLKRHHVFTIPHLKDDKYYCKILNGTLQDSDKHEAFVFSADGDAEGLTEPSAKRIKKAASASAKTSIDKPSAPPAPQLKQQKHKATAGSDIPDSCNEPAKEPASSPCASGATGIRGFQLAESFKWGALSFKYRKNGPAFQVDCLNRAHWVKYSWGSTTTCSKSMTFTPETKDMVIKRLKIWALEGLACETRDDHLAKSMDISYRPETDLLSDQEVEDQRPKSVLNAVAASSSAKPKAKASRAAKSKPAKDKPQAKGKARTQKKKGDVQSSSSSSSENNAIAKSSSTSSSSSSTDDTSGSD